MPLWLRHFVKIKKSHPKCISLGYLKINAIGNKFSEFPCLIEKNQDVFIVAESKLDSSFLEIQFLPKEIGKPYR